ncbi:MAG: M56 family metallopeptidase, partial [Clostridia bacterium]|nr:M56 family metallopeptidase [Clostridia bacterium]
RRHDHWWKPLGFLLLTVHWFNPVLWLAYVLLCRDIEMACDERVVKEYDMEKRADYSAALLRCSVKRSMISACPLAFGEADVKTRIKAVLNYRKPAVWVIGIAGILCVGTAVCFLTNPVENRTLLWEIEMETAAVDMESAEACISEPPYQGIIDDPFWSFSEKTAYHFYGTAKGEMVYTARHFVDSEYEWAYISKLYNAHKANNPSSDSFFTIPNSMLPLVPFIISIENEGAVPLRLVIYGSSDAKKIESHTVAAGESTTLRLETDRYWYMGFESVGFTTEPVSFRGSIQGPNSSTHTSVPQNETTLTLDDVILLSEKGESLTWEDFTGYKFIETGSGIYIRVYEIDETFDLMIGDGDFTHFRDDGTMTGTPWYIRLCADHWENYADVTKDDVAAFIAEHPYTTEPIGKSAGSETIQTILSFTDGQLIFDNTVVSNVKPAAVCEYRYIPVPVSNTMRENLFEAYFGERADDVFCKDEQKDVWQLGETMSGVFYQYNTVPHVSGASVFTVRYSVPNLIPFDDNRKGSGEPSGCTITAEEAAALCEPLLGSMTDITRYKIDYAHHYGNNGENPFYWICYKRILDGLTVNAFKDIYFFVDDNGVEKINGAFYDTEKTEEYTDYLTAEEAVDALAEQLDEVNWKEAGTSEVARIGLEYVTVKDSSGRITIVPIWRMELGNSEEERILNRNRILGIHAGTGELVQDWIGMGNYN